VIPRSSKIIDGRPHANAMLLALTERIVKLKATHSIIPKLAVVLVGQDPASLLYVRSKVSRAQSIGMLSAVINFDIGVSENELLQKLDELNRDTSVHGIIVQMPLPPHINTQSVLACIDPQKDVDGFHPLNVGRLYTGDDSSFIPCTPLGCLYLLKQYLRSLSGMHAVVIGRSQIVGRPVAGLLVRENCTVTVCHSYTKNLASITSLADIVISSMGRPRFLTAKYFKDSAVVLDVGITRINSSDNELFVGDVDFDDVIDKVSLITQVPGGIGPMTVAYLLSNTIHAAEISVSSRL
jgi:methylenetetrahydrofolate dehydrogenase (NADP+)/methenyltetrahydrofolate cyclohydrolase